MFKKILCAIDFSEFTEEVVQYGANIAKNYHSELHLLHVIPSINYFTPYESFLTPENLVAIESNIEGEVEKDIDKIVKKLDVPVKKVIKSGVIYAEIIEYAKSESIDLIVMGTHGRSAIEHMLMGSVAEKVVRKAFCPVLTIRPKTWKPKTKG